MLTPQRSYLDSIRRNPGPFTPEEFDGSEEAAGFIDGMKILWGNVGCLKNCRLAQYINKKAEALEVLGVRY
ncbi:NEDD8-activating enzyme E1 catalytic subunit protein [Rutstroemia sp. NJR-2017a BVV2]|nr:NEDD8-activating enzyme E1 catalytic subunit protein [Rutstroemia sp. NJR-2017a BVV2]